MREGETAEGRPAPPPRIPCVQYCDHMQGATSLSVHLQAPVSVSQPRVARLGRVIRFSHQCMSVKLKAEVLKMTIFLGKCSYFMFLNASLLYYLINCKDFSKDRALYNVIGAFPNIVFANVNQCQNG